MNTLSTAAWVIPGLGVAGIGFGAVQIMRLHRLQGRQIRDQVAALDDDTPADFRAALAARTQTQTGAAK